jgi:hypothetical protein
VLNATTARNVILKTTEFMDFSPYPDCDWVLEPVEVTLHQNVDGGEVNFFHESLTYG